MKGDRRGIRRETAIGVAVILLLPIVPIGLSRTSESIPANAVVLLDTRRKAWMPDNDLGRIAWAKTPPQDRARGTYGHAVREDGYRLDRDLEANGTSYDVYAGKPHATWQDWVGRGPRRWAADGRWLY